MKYFPPTPILPKFYSLLFSGLLLAFVLYVPRVVAQDISYFKAYGANFGEQGNEVVALDNGNVVTALQLSNPNSGGSPHPGLLLTNVAGHKVFCKKYPLIGQPSAAQHVLPNQEGFLIVGTSFGAPFVLQTNFDGEVLWSARLDITEALHVTDVIAVEDGYLMTGIGRYNTGNYPEIVVWKLTTGGTVAWAKQVETDNFHLRNLRIRQQQGLIYIAGTGKLDFNFLDVFVMALDSEANPIWTKHFDTPYDDELEEFLVKDDALYLIGRNYNLGTQYDVFLLKTNLAGELIAQRQFDGNGGDERARCATFLANGNLAISFDHGNSSSRSPAVMSIHPQSLSINWCKSYIYEANFTNYALDISPTNDGGFLLVGDMHVTGKIRDTYLLRATPNGDAGCFTNNYGIGSFPANFTSTELTDTSQLLSSTVLATAIIAEEALEVSELSLCANVPPLANFKATPHTIEACERGCYTFTDASERAPISWQWTFEGGTPASYNGQHPPEVCWTENGTYEVSLRVSSFDGTTTTTKAHVVNLECAPIIPNVYSPNEDGLNDWFRIQHLPAKFQLSIFNRWGQPVFESSDANKVWTGQNEQGDQACSAGVYFYELLDKDMKRSYSGTVQLVR